MKKIMAGVMAAALTFSIGLQVANAADFAWCGHHSSRTSRICADCGTVCRFVDADWDGVCDHCGISRRCEGAGTAAAAVCRDCGTVCRFVDANGDGVCDHCGTARHCEGLSASRICGDCGTVCRFVDVDGDGICDHCGTAGWFIDADSDGICDSCKDSCRFAGADVDDACGHCLGVCEFIDADNNGICDSCGIGRHCVETGHCGGHTGTLGANSCNTAAPSSQDNCGSGHSRRHGHGGHCR